MKNMQKIYRSLFIFLTFLMAWILMILPVPSAWHRVGPAWLTLMIIYWIFAQPQFVGIAVAWCVGLVMDSLYGGILGQYALSLMMVAFFARFLRYRIRLMSSWQQGLMIAVLVFIGQCILFVVQWLLGHPDKMFYYFISALSSMIVWPWLSRLMNFYEHKALG